MWFVLADDGKTKNVAKLKRRLENSMSVDEIKTSKARADKCKSSGFKDCG